MQLLEGLELEQVAELQEESILAGLQPAASQLAWIGERAAVAGKQNGARVGLISEQQVTPERAMAERRGAEVVVQIGIENQNRCVGSGLVPQRISPFGGVLAHQPEEDGPGELILQLEPRALPQIHRAAITPATHVLNLVVAVHPELIGWSPVQRQL